jgi:hypothetical protein
MPAHRLEGLFSAVFLILLGSAVAASASSLPRILGGGVKPSVNLCDVVCNAQNQCEAGGDDNPCTKCTYIFIYSKCERPST